MVSPPPAPAVERTKHPSGPGSTHAKSRQSLFPPTDWSLVRRASGHPGDESGGDALAALCARYWPPLYAYVRSRGQSREDAEDVVQEFFAKLLRNENLRKVSPDGGRLRTFLLVAMRRFLASRHRRRTARRRGGENEAIPIDSLDAEALVPADATFDPERIFARNWALTLLANVHERLRAEYARKGTQEVFDALAPLVSPAGGETSYAELARRLEISEGTLKVRVFRLRTRYRACLREEVARGLDDLSEIDDELRYLRDALRSPS